MGGMGVNDRAAGVLEQYDLKIYNIYRGRGVLICETEKGLKIVKELTVSRERAEFQDIVLTKIRESGYRYVDCFVKNTKKEIITLDKDNLPYIVKDWFEGKECNLKNEEETAQAVKSLAFLHNLLEDEYFCKWAHLLGEADLETEYEKHNRELKRVRKFLKEKHNKNDFELCFARNYEEFFTQGQEVLKALKASSYKELRKECIKKGKVYHGDFNYHNILISDKGVAITNFDKCSLGIQNIDLYQLIRKTLEKQNWNIRLGMKMIEEYEKVKKLSKEELENLYLQLSYPEKFWKIANYYYNSNKAWISGKSIEKLETLVIQNNAKRKFLDAFSKIL